MSQVKSITRVVAAIALVAGFAFVVPPASAAEDADVEQTEPESTNTIPPCAAFNPEYSAGPATAGIDPYCNVYVEIDQDLRPDEDPTEKCDVETTEDPKLVVVECQLSSNAEPTCYHIYWKTEVGPVTWEQRSSCEGDITVDEDWRPSATIETTDNCFYVYWKKEVGPVVWEQRSTCDGEIYVKEDWQP